MRAVQTLRDKDLTRPYPNMGYRKYPRIREKITSLADAISLVRAERSDAAKRERVERA